MADEENHFSRDLETINGVIKKHRITQGEICAKKKLKSQGGISQILSGKRTPRKKTICELATIIRSLLEEREIDGFDELPLLKAERDRTNRNSEIGQETSFITSPPAKFNNWFPRVFISYCRHAQKTIALSFKTFLEDWGLQVWIDLKNIPVGVDWLREIKAAIAEADFMVLLMCKEVPESQHVLSEIIMAQTRSPELEIIVVFVDAVSNDKLPSGLRATNYLSMHDPDEKPWEKLKERLCGTCSKDSRDDKAAK